MPFQHGRRLPPALQLVLVLGVAAGLRAAHLAHASTLPTFTNPVVDALAYHEHGLAVAAGDWLLGDTPLRMSPGYPYLLGAVYALLGDGPWPVVIVQSLAGLLTVVCVWDAARRVLGTNWAWLPALGMAAYGPAIFYESTRLATSPALALHAVLLWTVVRALERARPRLGDWVLAGVIWGLCCLLRPNALLLGLVLVPAAAGWLSWPWRRPLNSLARVILLVAGCAAAIAPIAARNWLAAGEWILLTDHGGQNFYIGNGPGATGSWRIPLGVQARGVRDSFAGFHEAAERQQRRRLTAREADRFWYAKGLQAMRSDPGAALRLMARKFHLYWNGYELASVHHYAFERRVNPVLAAPLLQFSVVAPFALLGSLLALGAGQPLRFIGGFNLTVCLGIVLFFVLGRYRMPMIPGAMIAAAFAVQSAARWWQARRALKLAISGAVLAAGVALAWPIGLDPGFANEYFRLAERYRALGRSAEAIEAYGEALALEPAHLAARYRLALLLEGQARSGEARTHWRELLERARERDDVRLEREAERRLRTVQ